MSTTGLTVAADAIVALHVAFVLFVVGGGVLVLRWRWLAWAHVPAAIWGIVIEFAGWVCPLTPIENALRARAGVEIYRSDFVEHYVLPVLYPVHLTRDLQVLLGTIVLALNGLVYWYLLTHRGRPMRLHERKSPWWS